jgi:hypothetical protein
MLYSVQYLRKGVTRGTSHHRGTEESAIASARAGLVSRGADRARVLNEAGVEVKSVQADA